MCYALTSFISGYVSGGLYSRNGGMVLHFVFCELHGFSSSWYLFVLFNFLLNVSFFLVSSYYYTFLEDSRVHLFFDLMNFPTSCYVVF